MPVGVHGLNVMVVIFIDISSWTSEPPGLDCTLLHFHHAKGTEGAFRS